ncbi:uncharacterized protein LOC116290733 isoform X2 [Actinia tenebrosa]|uniref:Uncharacterized protein LOC116290733 isoform X2 n=1 Tax=Actinia tenebrosa TaxID=6105 RepID=A0A6P8HM31_ACTTE|nr:uncharacterized protein LOC116290733 isoform X2 [Actinia tenebrosa]
MIQSMNVLELEEYVYGIGNDNCDPFPLTEDISTSPEANASLHWRSFDGKVSKVRLCMQPASQTNYSSGLCPIGFVPLLTTSDKGTHFLGQQEHYEIYQRLKFIGNLTTGNMWFDLLNVTKVDIGSTFLALVQFDNGVLTAKCNNLTARRLIEAVETHGPTTHGPTTHGGPPKQDKLILGTILGTTCSLVLLMLIVVIIIKYYKKCKRANEAQIARREDMDLHAQRNAPSLENAVRVI